jgi:hypothetical protein
MGERLRAMADEEHEQESGEAVRDRSLHDLEWPGYDSLSRDERVAFWRVLPVPGTPARDVI